MTASWMSLAGRPPVVADGPHRIEQTAPVAGQQIFRTSTTTVGPMAEPAAVPPARDPSAAPREVVLPAIQLVPV